MELHFQPILHISLLLLYEYSMALALVEDCLGHFLLGSLKFREHFLHH
jgi:hypothetical protein